MIEITEQECANMATVGVSLDDHTYMIGNRHNRVIDELVKHDIDPIPMRTEHIFFWGGDTRCATLPLARDAI